MSVPAFKEWSIICDVLGSGRQSIIIRKGGISEGVDGFRFRHPEFFLFPTLFHEQVERTTLDAAKVSFPPFGAKEITVRYFARVVWTRFVADWAALQAMQPFHVWQPETIRERFEYDEPNGVHLAFLRIFRLSEPWRFPDSPDYGGCKSWVDIPAPAQSNLLEAVLSDAEHEDRADAISSLLPTL